MLPLYTSAARQAIPASSKIQSRAWVAAFQADENRNLQLLRHGSPDLHVVLHALLKLPSGLILGLQVRAHSFRERRLTRGRTPILLCAGPCLSCLT